MCTAANWPWRRSVSDKERKESSSFIPSVLSGTVCLLQNVFLMFFFKAHIIHIVRQNKWQQFLNVAVKYSLMDKWYNGRFI